MSNAFLLIQLILKVTFYIFFTSSFKTIRNSFDMKFHNPNSKKSKVFSLVIALMICLNALLSQSNNAPDLDWLPNNQNLEKGTLSVPENHDDPKGKKIDITYVIVKARNPAKEAFPVIYFSGGPGGNTISPGFINFMRGNPLTEGRDLILFDQRGIGYSSPLPDMGIESFNILAQDADESEELRLTGMMIDRYKILCEEQGIDPQFYNTIQNARDVGMLFEHLGYNKYNLFGGSYGTRLARVVQDLFPEYINSSILDSPSPMSTDFLLQRLDSYETALGRIFDYCKSDDQCHKEYPNLVNDYFEAISALEKKPVKIVLGDSIDFYINAQDGLYLLRRLLYQSNSREMAPEFIQALKRGEGEIINKVLEFESDLTGGLNLTMLLSVEKFENFNPENTKEVISRAYENHALIPVKLGFFDAFYQAGFDWHNGHMPVQERKFKESSIPSLIFVNRFDPVTPPQYGYLFKEDLPNGKLLVLDEGGHGGGNEDCKLNVIMDFLNDPYQSLDTSCLRLYEK